MPHSPTGSPATTRIRRRTLATAAVLAIAVLATVPGGLLAPERAAAATLDGAVTNVRASDTDLRVGETFRLDFDWSVPDHSAPGDTFSLALPDALENTNTALIPLTDESGAVVARGIWSGKTLVFTLTDYVTAHPFDVHGTGWLTARLDEETVGDGTTTVTTDVAGTTLTFEQHENPGGGGGTPADPPTEPETAGAGKWGGWTRSDHGTVETDDAIYWVIAFPVYDHETTDVTMTDVAPASGWTFACDSVVLHGRHNYPLEDWAYSSSDPLELPIVSDYSCTPERLTVTLGRMPAFERVEVNIHADVTVPELASYRNDASFSATSEEPTTATTTVVRRDGGGTGTGQAGSQLRLRKLLAGAIPADAPSSVALAATCTPPGGGEPVVYSRSVPTDGSWVVITGLQPGAECSVTEPDPGAATPSFSAESVTIDADTPVDVVVTNTYDAPPTTGLTIRKVVVDAGMNDVPEAVDVDVVCVDGEETVLDTTASVPVGGETTLDGLPVGADCTVTEVDPGLATVRYSTPDGAIRLAESGNVVVVTNSYPELPTLPFEDPEEPQGLAGTGVDTTFIVAVGGSALALGAVALVVGFVLNRRRSAER